MLRIASFAAPLTRDGPGLLLRDILRGEDDALLAIAGVIAAADPQILVLTKFDYDHDRMALDAFAAVLADLGASFPHSYSALPNSGLATGLDMDGDGRTGTARDAQGYGDFAGQGGMAILSRWPIDEAGVRDLSGLLWRDLPGAVLPQIDGQPFLPDPVLEIQRLSSTAHWIVPIEHPAGPVTLMAWAATPPAFDGPEMLNRLRNRDELRLWSHVLDGGFGPAPEARFVILGNANLDPFDGDGMHEAMREFLADPRLQDPQPRSAGGALVDDPRHQGDPAQDTAAWPRAEPGNLRVTYVLPSADWTVADAGVFWPAPDAPGADLLGPDGLRAGPHRLVWVDLVLPQGD